MDEKRFALGNRGGFKWIDLEESYGRRIVKYYADKLTISNCLNIGRGFGDDLKIVKDANPNCSLYGIDSLKKMEMIN